MIVGDKTIKPAEIFTLEEANNYMDAMMKKSRLISKGVFIILCSTIPLFFFLALTEGNITTMNSTTATAIGLVSLLILFSLGVSYIIRSGQYDSKLATIDKKEFEIAHGFRSILMEKLEVYRRVYTIRLSIGVAMILTCPIPLLIVSLLEGSEMMVLMMVSLLILIFGVGVYNIVRVAVIFDAYNRLVQEGEYAPENKQKRKRIVGIAGIYWPLITAIYIGWSLWTMQWGITWIVWPVAAIVFASIVWAVIFFDER